MEINDTLEKWLGEPGFSKNIACLRQSPSREGKFVPFPEHFSQRIRAMLAEAGIDALYAHQAEAIEAVFNGENLVLSTGTSSGKSLCYTVPILTRQLEDPGTTALLIFPTKALTNDQYNTFNRFARNLSGEKVLPAIYDGDTPAHQRSTMRKIATILMTNPDMLHQGILPHHTNWAKFFSGLRLVVIDEMHVYRGVFGSHFANLIRRLKRVCAFYNSYPQFILTSATIGNPAELAQAIIEQPVHLIEQDCSPKGPQNLLIYNPPFVDEKLGIRKSSLDFGVSFTQKLMRDGHQTLIFARTRRTVEMLLAYLRDRLPASERQSARAYRSGYLKSERREIEQGLKSGALQTVFSTSALELGIDIGDLDAVILVGFPGTIATARQRFGRVGRKQQQSMAILIVTNEAMDQYLANHPEYLLDQNPEQALIDPQNLMILLQHIRCAAFELPFTAGESFGSLEASRLAQFLEFLARSGVLTLHGEDYFWVADQYPASEVSLRSSTPEIVTLKVKNGLDEEKIIGQLDANTARWYVHKDAVYLHDAEVYEVIELNLEEGICQLKPSQPEYFTIPVIDTKIIDHSLTTSVAYKNYSANFGELNLEISIQSYQKKRWMTNELLGTGQLDMPPQSLHTTGFWISLTPSYIEGLRKQSLWGSDANEYGPEWQRLRQKIILRDAATCRGCGRVFSPTELQVHHLTPFRSFADPALANQASNLVTLCPSCHRKAEMNVMIRSGLAAAAYALRSMAPLLIMCDPEDISLLSENRSGLNAGDPAILVYDKVPGGIGLSKKLYDLRNFWIERAVEVIEACPCECGCPACVGPVGEPGYGGKKEGLALLKGLRDG